MVSLLAFNPGAGHLAHGRAIALPAKREFLTLRAACDILSTNCIRKRRETGEAGGKPALSRNCVAHERGSRAKPDYPPLRVLDDLRGKGSGDQLGSSP